MQPCKCRSAIVGVYNSRPWVQLYISPEPVSARPLIFLNLPISSLGTAVQLFVLKVVHSLVFAYRSLTASFAVFGRYPRPGKYISSELYTYVIFAILVVFLRAVSLIFCDGLTKQTGCSS